ncbi:MAG: hypothetical protein AAF628_22365 [Planctomycetota bacterium]
MTDARPSPGSSLLVLGGALAAYLTLALTSSWVCDDAYIAFRYSRNFAEGLGLRYNVGVEPPVEGYTQLGWVLWMGIFEALQFDPRVWSRATTITAGAVLLLWLTRFAQTRLGFGAVGALATGLFFAACPTTAVWASGGLGTMAFALAIFATFERLLGDLDRPRPVQAAVAALIAATLRADALFWLGLMLGSAVVIGLLTRRRALRRAALLGIGALTIATAAHTAWRLSYYGDWLPNTARNKVGLSGPALARGVDYLLTYWLTVPAAAVVLVAALPLVFRRGAWRLRVAAGLAAATFLYGVLVGGDFMAMGRFVLPAIPFLALIVGAWVSSAWAWKGALPALLVTAAAIGGALPALYDVHLTPPAWRESHAFRWGKEYVTEYGFWHGMQTRAFRWANLGRALAVHTKPDESLVRGAIGAVGYYSGLVIYDQLGLVNRDVVDQIEVNPNNLKIPGHDRVAGVQFFADHNPTYVDAQLLFRRPREADERGVPKRIRRRAQGAAAVRPVTREDGLPADGYLVLWKY